MSLLELVHAQNPWWSSASARPSAPERPRKILGALRGALLEPDLTRALVLLGPRQVGKTRLLWGLVQSFLDDGWPAPNITYFDFKDDRYDRVDGLREVLCAKPLGFREDAPRFLAFDEVTQAPRWDLALKQVVDGLRSAPPARRSRVIVTDSAASLVRGGARESLQGRIDEVRVHGLTFGETLRLQSVGDEEERDVLLRVPGALERYLARGGLPEHVFTEDVRLVWERLRADIADRAIARDLGRDGVDVERVTALFRALVQDSGGIFEAKNRAPDVPQEDGRGTDQRTIRRWKDLLEHASLVDRLPSWHPGMRGGVVKSSRALSARHKVYAEDHGFIPAFSPYARPLQHDNVVGAVFETVVFTHLRELRERRGDFGLGFYREGSNEIDFVLTFEDAVLGIEVTSAADAAKKRSRLRQVAGRAELDRWIVVHGGALEPRDVELGSEWPLGAFLLEPDRAVEQSLEWVRRSR